MSDVDQKDQALRITIEVISRLQLAVAAQGLMLKYLAGALVEAKLVSAEDLRSALEGAVLDGNMGEHEKQALKARIKELLPEFTEPKPSFGNLVLVHSKDELKDD